MPIIKKYVELYKDQNYDRINNPDQLPIKDLLPIGISWTVGNTTHRLDFENGAVIQLLIDMTGIAIVKISSDQLVEPAQAWIINADGNIRFEIQLPTWAINGGKFYDVYYIDGDLSFFFYANNDDYRMVINDVTGDVKDVLKSR